jgi:LEA14-like dessication related protein
MATRTEHARGGIHRRLRRVALLGALAASGCLTFERPTLRVAEVRLASLGFQGGSVAVTLLIDNPNGYALESQGFQYRLSFTDDADGKGEWATLAEGRDDQKVSVPAHDTASVELDVPFELSSVGTALQRLLRRGELEYRFTGELRVTRPRSVRVPFDERGAFRP